MKKLIFYILSGLLLFAGCTSTTEGYKSNEVIVVSHDTINANSSAVSVTINVNSLVPYEIETTEAWITPSKKSGERGISEFRLDIAENKSFEGRTATVTIKNLMYGLSQDITILQEKAIPSNTIYYTSSNGRVVKPYNEDAFGANIVSNTYNNGQGTILFDGSVTSIGYCAFYQCANLASVTISNQVTEIGDGAFFDCISLTSATIPDRVTEIGTGAFAGCSSLASVAIGNSVTSIGEQAFIQCTSLTSITIPDGVTLIGNHAFYECSSLTSVYCKPTTPPSGGNEMFDDNASGRKIYVPTASVGMYKSASGWSSYADFIVGNDFESGAVAPENPENPENPETPETPDTPENPDTPEGGGNEGGSTVEVFTLNGSDVDNTGSTYTTTTESFTATDGSVWKILGYYKTKTDIIQLGAKNNNYILTPATTNGINTIKFTCSGSYYVALWDPSTNELISGMVAEPSVANYDGDGTITFTLPAGYKQVKIISTRNADGTYITSKNAATYIKKIVVTSK